MIFAVMVLFTLLSGDQVYLAKEQVGAVAPPTTCQHGAGAKLYTVQAPFCVRETVEEAASKLNQSNKTGG